MALLLRNQGIRRIRPLQGGLDAWRERGYPVANTVLTQIETHISTAPAVPAKD